MPRLRAHAAKKLIVHKQIGPVLVFDKTVIFSSENLSEALVFKDRFKRHFLGVFNLQHSLQPFTYLSLFLSFDAALVPIGGPSISHGRTALSGIEPSVFGHVMSRLGHFESPFVLQIKVVFSV